MNSTTARRNYLRGELLKKKGLSLRAWALHNGFKNTVVQMTIYRAIDQDRRPKAGTQSLAIIEAIEADTGIRICG